MKINEQWKDLKEVSNTNIQSEKGILNHQIHFIQTEGYYGNIKENEISGASIIGQQKGGIKNSRCMRLKKNKQISSVSPS